MILRGHYFLKWKWKAKQLFELGKVAVYKMTSSENLTIKELKTLAKADSIENMPRQQLESIFTTPSSVKPVPKPEKVLSLDGYEIQNTFKT